ncbi:hypothetical protein B0H12DRAFT_1326115 [Mycena haematopus]|nr:hypothetical protein B0H12DRAFT_1326115 [Mycena haematopus]
MDDDMPAEMQLDEESTMGRYSGGFFPRSKQFTIAGGVFTSKVTNNFHQGPSIPSDFRMIPLGDIDLQREIRLELGVVDRRHERTCVRRVYAAKIEGTSGTTAGIINGRVRGDIL